MDDELLALQEELARVQEDTSDRAKLSERNVVDLVLKLRELGKLDDLIITSTGKEYLTWAKLKQEVSYEINFQHGGRARLDEIASSLNVELTIVEKALKEILQSVDQSDMEMLSPVEVITSSYVDQVLDELAELFESGKRISIGQLATRFGLPVEKIKQVLDMYMKRNHESGIVLKNGVIVTKNFVEGQKRKVRGLFSGATRPLAILPVALQMNMDVAEVERILLGNDSIAIAGEIRGGEYVPHVFSKVQRVAVDNFFAANGFISFEMGKKMFVQDKMLLSFLQSSFPDALEFDSGVIAGSSVASFLSEIEDCIASDGYVNCKRSVHLPSMLQDTDVVTLIAKCDSVGERKTSKAVVLHHHFVVSKGMMRLVERLLIQVATQKAQDSFKRRPEKDNQNIMKIRSSRRSLASSSSGKSKGKKKGNTTTADDDDEYGDDSPESFMVKELDRSCIAEDWVEHVRAQIPQLHGEEDDLFLQELVLEFERIFRSAFVAHYEELSSSVLHGDVTSRRKKQTNVETEFFDFYNQLQLFVKGLGSLKRIVGKEKDESLFEGFETWVINDIAFEIVGYMIEHQRAQYAVELKEEANYATIESCKAILNQFPDFAESVVKQLTRLLNCFATGKPFDVMTEVDKAARECGLVIRPVDKKTAKQILQNARTKFMGNLSVPLVPSDTALLNVVALILLQNKQILVPELTHSPCLPLIQRWVDVICSTLLSAEETSQDLKTLNENIQNGCDNNDEIIERLKEATSAKKIA